MTLKVIFLLEEPSMKWFLDQILPRIVPAGVEFQTVPHQGCSDLRKSIPKKLKCWFEPDKIIHFVVVHDRDDKDCRQLKQELRQLCDAIRPGVLIRIPCQELEAWYWGDLQAVSEAMGKNITNCARKRKFRNPDAIIDPKEHLYKLFPDMQQCSSATAIGERFRIDKNTSESFRYFVSGVRKLCGLESDS